MGVKFRRLGMFPAHARTINGGKKQDIETTSLLVNTIVLELKSGKFTSST